MSTSGIIRLTVAAAILLVWVVGAAKLTSAESSNFISVDITGVQHMGKNFNIPEFYVDGAWASNVGREGGGGRSVCCVMLPRTWREGIMVEVRWAVTDWSKVDLSAMDKGNYSSLIREGTYKALVPLEKFTIPGNLYVHFFPGAKVRVLSSSLYPEDRAHPVQSGDQSADDNATPGQKISELFTSDELKKMEGTR